MQVDIAAGGWHSTALTDDGEVFPCNTEGILLIVIAMFLYYHSFGRYLNSFVYSRTLAKNPNPEPYHIFDMGTYLDIIICVGN